MVFPELRSTENYAMKNPAIASDLSQLSLCFFIKLVQDQGDQIVVSYARVHSNDMIVEIYPTRTEFYVGFKMFRQCCIYFFRCRSGNFFFEPQ